MNSFVFLSLSFFWSIFVVDSKAFFFLSPSSASRSCDSFFFFCSNGCARVHRHGIIYTILSTVLFFHCFYTKNGDVKNKIAFSIIAKRNNGFDKFIAESFRIFYLFFIHGIENQFVLLSRTCGCVNQTSKTVGQSRSCK